ncbi:TrmH family RNA methyltransferase [Candidatus Dojkabacteria bacterium HGW-Dojkabacteria-1]|uniref:TrmH family RNA methyltransferase n=1 Tax=Candidatus Dojkabacteria bacterium HGW-Dojkabacteria-1 TaxID=2013761 RepID=A0A2N2F2J6_9BACT|nr:MAG: TrmH family RNA methyltransferase [Candidatus Dojkabacteria bacterium HGW-Dojkabacteria-1]
MFLPKVKKYQKKFDYSYAFGAFPVIELLKLHPEKVYQVLFKTDTQESEGIKEIMDLCMQKSIPFEYSNRAIEKIAVKENTYVVGVFKKYESELTKDENHLVLVNPMNLGNIGTVIRTMLGFDFKNLGIVKPAGDIFDPMVVRSTMGALFHINFEMFDSIEEYLKKYPNQNIYPFMLKGAKEIGEVQFKKPLTIIHGNESKGLEDRYMELGQSVYIPHSDNIDSLNLSVATAISLWEVSKKS